MLRTRHSSKWRCDGNCFAIHGVESEGLQLVHTTVCCCDCMGRGLPRDMITILGSRVDECNSQCTECCPVRAMIRPAVAVSSRASTGSIAVLVRRQYDL